MRTSPQRGVLSETDPREDLACVQVAVVVGDTGGHMGEPDSIETVLGCVNEDPAHRIGFLGINPLQKDALDLVRKGIDAGLKGVALSPADQAYRPTHDECLEVLAFCQSTTTPVLIANPRLFEPQSVLEFARPVLLDDVLRQMPALRLIIGDLGHGWIDESLTLIAKHDQVYAEISGVVLRPWSLYSTLMSASERGQLRKLFFGSGYPRETPERALERIYTINSVRSGSQLPTIPRESLRTFVERNSLACIGIDLPPTTAPSEQPQLESSESP
ncbi:MAG: amidohydrolase family protein [Planctomycetota bacterium]|jgi:predicted TIM-barrel fold metal-dependent hydrolase